MPDLDLIKQEEQGCRTGAGGLGAAGRAVPFRHPGVGRCRPGSIVGRPRLAGRCSRNGLVDRGREVLSTLMSAFPSSRRVNLWLHWKRPLQVLPGKAGGAAVKTTVDHTLMRGLEPHDR